MTHIRLARRTGISLVALVAATAAPCLAQSADSLSNSSSDAVGVGPLRNSDATSVGGAPLSDVSPRLPRVNYGGNDILTPVATRPGQVRGRTVLDRSRPEYDPVGIRTGGFRLYPQVSARVGYGTNTLTRNSGNGDVFGRLRGALTARSDWNRHSLQADGFVDQRAYSRFQTENGTTYNGSVAGRLDVTRSLSLDAGAQIGRIIVDRRATTEFITTRRPVRYDLRSANAGANLTAGRFSYTLVGSVSEFDYKNAETPAGLPLNQQFRDFTLWDAALEVAYGSPEGGPALFGSVRTDARRFRVRNVLDRDADGLELLGGVRGDITPLLRGRLGAGYLWQSFKDPSLKTRGGLALDVRLDYLASELTTVSLRARRLFKNVASVTAPATLSTELAVGVDHELLPNLILSPSANYENADYVNSPLRVKRYGADLGAIYYVDRRFRLDGNVGYRKRSQNIAIGGRNFDEINVTAGVTFSL
ncbi:outer membrane beta-barrel protein [Sphingomonas solaris]|uniref:Outer membrane beta-barrel protein n=1 Tax=Alterirhizorhabdus solaris TaxID=2529389 RepID=A0A558QXY5_9SPHN|nr:outer membrane beta-barrel protein [Sphingomonas solaris]TVV71975.1 outer membrane beta-barrel protein [Sphingomonas solaris]